MATAPEICPHCGAQVPLNATACPECGSDEKTGWAEGADTSDLDLPDQDFNYDEFVRKEFPRESPIPRGIHWFWWLIAGALVVVLVWFCLR
jgi:hypothetical protein